MSWVARWLEQSRQSARWSALALVWLLVVAPLWHVCELGGGKPHPNPSHHGAAPASQAQNLNPQDPRAPLICFCPTTQSEHAPNEDAQNGAMLGALEHHKHATCLALLLQTMPFANASAPVVLVLQTQTQVPARDFSQRASIGFEVSARGRGPPVSI